MVNRYTGQEYNKGGYVENNTVTTVNMEGIVRELLEVKRWFNNSHDICY